MKKTIIIGIIIIGISVYSLVTLDRSVVAQVSDLKIVTEVETIEDVTFTTSDIQFATTTDENDVEIKIGLAIPINIATSTGSVDETIVMNFDGYNQCRTTKTKTVCLAELDDDIQQNIDAFKQNKIKELDELKRQSYEDEIVL